jgi:hypothetical protein
MVTINTANGTTSAVVTNQQLINLPSTARAVLPFALLMPAAVSATHQRYHRQQYVRQWCSLNSQRLGPRRRV